MTKTFASKIVSSFACSPCDNNNNKVKQEATTSNTKDTTGTRLKRLAKFYIPNEKDIDMCVNDDLWSTMFQKNLGDSKCANLGRTVMLTSKKEIEKTNNLSLSIHKRE